MFVIQHRFYNEDDGHRDTDLMIGPYATEEEAEAVKSDLENFFPRLDFVISQLDSPTGVLQYLREFQEGRACYSGRVPETPEALEEEAAEAASPDEDCDYAKAVRLTQRAWELRENPTPMVQDDFQEEDY